MLTFCRPADVEMHIGNKTIKQLTFISYLIKASMITAQQPSFLYIAPYMIRLL